MLLLPILTASISVSIYLSVVFPSQDVPAERIVSFLDAACKERIEPFIDKSYKELADYVGAYEQKMLRSERTSLTRASGLLRSDTSSTSGTARVSAMRNLN